jgi:hypothetical protein
MSSMIKKTMSLFVLILLATSLIGVTYGMWSEALFVNVTVKTGTLDAMWTVGTGYDSEPPGKDFSNITGTLSPDKKTLTVTVKNAYPCIDYYLPVDINNTGTIPWIIQSFNFVSGTIPPNSVIEFLPDPDRDPDIAIGVQVHPNHEAYGLVHVHLSNDAEENEEYTFTVTVVVVQWNEYTPPAV